MYDIVVFSGGGVRLASTLGAYQYAIDGELVSNVKVYIGTSMGALISIFLGVGVRPIDILSILMKFDIYGAVEPACLLNFMTKYGFFTTDKMYNMLVQCMQKYGVDPHITMKQYFVKYGKKLTFVTYNITKDKCEYISYENYPDIPCAVAGCLSACIPLYFMPMEYNGCKYVDGAVYNNFALDYAVNLYPSGKILGFALSSNCNAISNVLDYISYLYVLPYSAGKQKVRLNDQSRLIISPTYEITLPIPINIENATKVYADVFINSYKRLKSDKVKTD